MSQRPAHDGEARSLPSGRDRFLLRVVQRIAEASGDAGLLLRGSLAADALGWAPRLPEDIDLVSDAPLDVDLSSLTTDPVAGLRLAFLRPPQSVDFGRSGIEVVVCSIVAVGDSGEELRFGIDVGTREFDYSLVKADLWPVPMVAPEWLVAEKMHLVVRRFQKRSSLSEVRDRDLIDVARWGGVGLQGAVSGSAADALGLARDDLRMVEGALADETFPRFWKAQWRKALAAAPDAFVHDTLVEAWQFETQRLLG